MWDRRIVVDPIHITDEIVFANHRFPVNGWAPHDGIRMTGGFRRTQGSLPLQRTHTLTSDAETNLLIFKDQQNVVVIFGY